MERLQSLAHDIEEYILNLIENDENNFISLRRKELAEMFSCVPSQINYVLRSRFSPEHGFLIESRRGEHGYIKILRISCDTPDEKSNHIADLVGSEITLREARRSSVVRILCRCFVISYDIASVQRILTEEIVHL